MAKKRDPDDKPNRKPRRQRKAQGDLPPEVVDQIADLWIRGRKTARQISKRLKIELPAVEGQIERWKQRIVATGARQVKRADEVIQLAFEAMHVFRQSAITNREKAAALAKIKTAITKKAPAAIRRKVKTIVQSEAIDAGHGWLLIILVAMDHQSFIQGGPRIFDGQREYDEADLQRVAEMAAEYAAERATTSDEQRRRDMMIREAGHLAGNFDQN